MYNLARYHCITEERLCQGLETLDIGFAIFDQQHNVVVGNRAFCAIYTGIDLLIKPGVCRCDILRAAVAADLLKPDGALENWLAQLRDIWSRQARSVENMTIKNGQSYHIVNQRGPTGDIITHYIDISAT